MSTTHMISPFFDQKTAITTCRVCKCAPANVFFVELFRVEVQNIPASAPSTFPFGGLLRRIFLILPFMPFHIFFSKRVVRGGGQGEIEFHVPHFYPPPSKKGQFLADFTRSQKSPLFPSYETTVSPPKNMQMSSSSLSSQRIQTGEHGSGWGGKRAIPAPAPAAEGVQ